MEPVASYMGGDPHAKIGSGPGFLLDYMATLSYPLLHVRRLLDSCLNSFAGAVVLAVAWGHKPATAGSRVWLPLKRPTGTA